MTHEPATLGLVCTEPIRKVLLSNRIRDRSLAEKHHSMSLYTLLYETVEKQILQEIL